MSSISNIAVSGIQAYTRLAEATAHNIANANTRGYKRLVSNTVERPGGGVDSVITRDESPGPLLVDGYGREVEGREAEVGGPPDGYEDLLAANVSEGSNVELATEMINMNEALRGYQMMTGILKREDEMIGSLLDAFS